jgi:hypothetical protein
LPKYQACQFSAVEIFGGSKVVTENESQFIDELMRQISDITHEQREVMDAKLNRLDESLIETDRQVRDQINEIMRRVSLRQRDIIYQLEDLKGLITRQAQQDYVSPDDEVAAIAGKYAPPPLPQKNGNGHDALRKVVNGSYGIN